MTKATVALCVLVVASACAAKLTPQGRLVREGPPEIRGECEFLGVVEATDRGARTAAAVAGGAAGFSNGAIAGQAVGRSMSGSSTKMLRHVRNKVAEMGGDIFVVATIDRFDMQAEAYRCFRPAPAFRVRPREE